MLFLSDILSEGVRIVEGCDIILGKVVPIVLVIGGPGVLDVVTVEDDTGIIDAVLCGEASGLITLNVKQTFHLFSIHPLLI